MKDKCPKCHAPVPSGVLRCPRCTSLVVELKGCTGSCKSCSQKSGCK